MTSNLSLKELVSDLAAALKTVDNDLKPQENPKFKPGVGPLKERTAVSHALAVLQEAKPNVYPLARSCRYPNARGHCDIVIPQRWAIEFKLVRPFGDNGKEDEHWLQNLLYPYEGNVSAIGDALKLRASKFLERRAIVVIGFEHSPPKIELARVIRVFELIASEIVGIALSPREEAAAAGLIHPVHQQLPVFGWEVV